MYCVSVMATIRADVDIDRLAGEFNLSEIFFVRSSESKPVRYKYIR